MVRPGLSFAAILAFCLATLAGSAMYLTAGTTTPPALAWMNGAALVLGMASCLALLARNIPLQNVLAICVIISVLACIENRIPGSISPPASGALSLIALSMSWITVVLTARFMARLLLSGRRGIGAYGIWVWLLASILSAHLNIAISTIATAATAAGNPPLPGFFQTLRWALTALAMLVCIAPWLIPKRPTPPLESREPVLLWLGANLLGASAAIHLQGWLQASVILSVTVTATAFAVGKFSGSYRHTAPNPF